MMKTFALVGLALAGLLAVAAPASAANGSRQTTVTRNGPHDYSVTRTYTGPNGRSVTRSGEIACGRFACSRSGTITGPNGGSASTAGWWWH
jgi:hypothetical protein